MYYKNNIFKDLEVIPALRYIISIKKNNGLFKLFEIRYPNDDNISKPVLEQGIHFSKSENADLGMKYTEHYRFLKIINRTPTNTSFKCLNYKINHDNSFFLISKERLTTESQEGYIGYCIDTVTKNTNLGVLMYPKNIIIFNQAYDNLTCKWICNEDIK